MAHAEAHPDLFSYDQFDEIFDLVDSSDGHDDVCRDDSRRRRADRTDRDREAGEVKLHNFRRNRRSRHLVVLAAVSSFYRE